MKNSTINPAATAVFIIALLTAIYSTVYFMMH